MNQEQQPVASEASPPAGTGFFRFFRQDFLASIVVFLVALPLCMGIAIASGVPVAAGLITGIVGGLIVGWIAGAPLQVSGPAAGLTVIVFDVVQNYGLEVLGVAVLIGGALQLAAGLLGFGRWFRAVSPAVIQGMLAGIGVLIFSSQFHVMVDDAPKGSGIQNILSIPEAIQKGLPLPELGTSAERTLRRDLLQSIGAVHEQQVQLRELAAEQFPAYHSDEPALDESGAPVEMPAVDELQLKPLVGMQQELSGQLTVLVERLESDGVYDLVRDPEALHTATDQSLTQMAAALSDLKDGHVENIGTSQADVQHSLETILTRLKNHDWAAKIGLLTIISLVLWKVAAPKSLTLVPAPLVAIVIATIATAVLQLPVLYVEMPDNLWSEIHFPSLAVLQTLPFTAVLQSGIVLAVVASAETLLCATAVDQMQTETRTNYDKELAAQGVGNMICGVFGALPMTGVIVRSSANVDAGGRTRLSTILHGVWLLVFVSVLAFVLRMIPTAALAAMLVYTGYKLVNIKAIRALRQYGWGEIAVYAATLLTIVCTDLLTGVITGIVFSALKLLYRFSHMKTHLELDSGNGTAVLRIVGAATFIRLPRLADALTQVPEGAELHVDISSLTYIDHACLDLLWNWEKQHEGAGGRLTIDWESLRSKYHEKRQAPGQTSGAEAKS